MVEEAWLDEGGIVIQEFIVTKHVNYMNWIGKNYPEIHKECINAIVDLKEIVDVDKGVIHGKKS